MKTATQIAAVLLGAMVAVTGAQSTQGFPECAQWCIRSMQEANKTSELGCAAGDNACLCRNANFLYGVRDCSAELCASVATSQQATQYTNEFCSSNGVNLSTVTSGGGPAATGTGAASSGGAGGAGSSSAISTSAIVSTVTGADGSATVSTVGSSTIFGPGGAAGGSSGSGTATGTATTVTSEELTTITSGSSTITSTLGSTTFVTTPTPTNSEGGSETGGSGTGSGSGPSSSSSSSSTGFAPQMTAAPAGIFAAVGIAALLL